MHQQLLVPQPWECLVPLPWGRLVTGRFPGGHQPSCISPRDLFPACPSRCTVTVFPGVLSVSTTRQQQSTQKLLVTFYFLASPDASVLGSARPESLQDLTFPYPQWLASSSLSSGGTSSQCLHSLMAALLFLMTSQGLFLLDRTLVCYFSSLFRMAFSPFPLPVPSCASPPQA